MRDLVKGEDVCDRVSAQTEYESGLEIQKAYRRLKCKAQDEYEYTKWRNSSCAELEKALPSRNRDEFLKIKSLNKRWFVVRKAILKYLKDLLEKRDQEDLDSVYRLTRYQAQDANLEHFVRGRKQNPKMPLLLFLGAGASIGARNPEGRPLPGGNQLSQLITRDLLQQESQRSISLEQAAALAQEEYDRQDLRNFVQDFFCEAKPLWQHATMPFLSPHAVFTTNYDNLIEEGWKLHDDDDSVDIDPCEPVLSLDRTAWDLRNKIPVIKPHGSVGHCHNSIGEGGLVLTQFDYFEMISKHQQLIADYLKDFEKVFVVFIGYSLLDMDIGSQLWSKWQEARSNNDDVKWYAVFPSSQQECKMYEKHLGVRVINRKFHEFMKELDEKVDFIPADWKFGEIPNLRDQGLIG